LRLSSLSVKTLSHPLAVAAAGGLLIAVLGAAALHLFG
jgi:hypothetical protein